MCPSVGHKIIENRRLVRVGESNLQLKAAVNDVFVFVTRITNAINLVRMQ
jgi:hypothetical protein